MANELNSYETILADIDARIAKLQATREGILDLMSATGGNPGGGPSNQGPSAFLGMSIPDAAKKYLSAVKEKKSTQEIIDALTAGGLPPAKYTTVYNTLTRRKNQVGDIVNMRGDWGLAEWYPNHRFKKSTKEEEESKNESNEKKAATA